MTSYFYLELDTTPPHIEIYAPSYTTREIFTTITVQASEPLGTHQEIYVLDSKGKRIDYTFRLDEENNRLDGKIIFNNVAYGIATLFVRLTDQLGNLSNTATHSINIISSLKANELSLSTFVYIQPLSISSQQMQIQQSKKLRQLQISSTTRVTDKKEKTFPMEISIGTGGD